jgi:hypothetical protein
MGQKEAISKLKTNSSDFIELHTEDLVKDCLRWHQLVNKCIYPNDVLPSVIRCVDSSLTAVR